MLWGLDLACRGNNWINRFRVIRSGLSPYFYDTIVFSLWGLIYLKYLVSQNECILFEPPLFLFEPPLFLYEQPLFLFKPPLFLNHRSFRTTTLSFWTTALFEPLLFLFEQPLFLFEQPLFLFEPPLFLNHCSFFSNHRFFVLNHCFSSSFFQKLLNMLFWSLKITLPLQIFNQCRQHS